MHWLHERAIITPQGPGRWLVFGLVIDISALKEAEQVRNKFHAHDVDQVLIVTAGKGIVATEKGEKVVTIGEVVLFPAGEKHWHGATKDSEFSHLVVTRVGGKTTQLED